MPATVSRFNRHVRPISGTTSTTLVYFAQILAIEPSSITAGASRPTTAPIMSEPTLVGFLEESRLLLSAVPAIYPIPTSPDVSRETLLPD